MRTKKNVIKKIKIYDTTDAKCFKHQHLGVCDPRTFVNKDIQMNNINEKTLEI